MRFYGIALLASTAVLGACGGEKAATDTAAANAAAASATTPPAATTPAAMTPAATTPAPAAGAAAAAPATGKTVEVKMIGDASGYKFEPANVTIKQGDAVKFVMTSGGPHNVAFQGITDAAAQAQIDANMSGAKMGALSSPMLMQPNEAYTVSFAKVPAGTYNYTCTPHAAMNMKGVVTVK
ncbi:MAG: plastocyanin/azurin family copper-binding protein [bacterium]